MNKVRIVLSLAMILGLMLAVALPSYARNPDRGKPKDPKPPASHPEKTKEPKGKGGQNAPTATAEAMVTICHKPLTPAEKTLQVPESAVPGHLGHGDYEGACLEVTPSIWSKNAGIAGTGTTTGVVSAKSVVVWVPQARAGPSNGQWPRPM